MRSIRYWERRIEANGRYENLYTLGMRGKDDEPMYAGGTLAEKIGCWNGSSRDQRGILTRHVNPDPAKVPQVFIPYTEVLGLYDAGHEGAGGRDHLLAGRQLRIPPAAADHGGKEAAGRIGRLLSHPVAQRRDHRLHLAEHHAIGA